MHASQHTFPSILAQTESPSSFARCCSTAAKALAGQMAFAFTIMEYPDIEGMTPQLIGASSALFPRESLKLRQRAAVIKAVPSRALDPIEYTISIETN
jgi:hypothetical protein